MMDATGRTMVLAVFLLAGPAAAQQGAGETSTERSEKLVELVQEAVKPKSEEASPPSPGVLSELDPLRLPPPAPPRGRIPAEAKAVVRVLKERRVALQVEKQDLSLVLDLLREMSGLSFVVSQKAREAMERDRPRVTLLLKNLPLENALNLIALHLGSYSFTVRHGAVILVLNQEVRPRMVTRLYPVEDLVRPVRDFPAPTLALKIPGEAP